MLRRARPGIHHRYHCFRSRIPTLRDDDKYTVAPWFWILEDNLKLRGVRDHVPYDLWNSQGFLETTEGNVVHYGYIEKFIEDLDTQFNIRQIAFDR